MKILVVVPTLGGGGAERVVSVLTKEWAKSHQVSIAIFDGSKMDYDYGGRITDLRLPASNYVLTKIYNVVARSIRLARLIRRERPDRVISFLESANIPAILAATLTVILDKLYVSVHCNPATLPLSYRILFPTVYRLPRGVITVSEGVKKALSSMGLPPTTISVNPNPVAKRWQPINTKETASPLSVRFVLGVGRLHRVKGFDRLLQAFRLLTQSEVQLVILGEGDERANLVQLARHYGIEKRVHLPGRVDDIDLWYRHAECFVLSSRHEAWPMVLMEAMANECPVVSFDCKYGPSEFIKDGETGLLVPDGDLGGLALAIARVLDDEGLSRHISVGGRERVRNYCAEKVAPCWLGVGYIDC